MRCIGRCGRWLWRSWATFSNHKIVAVGDKVVGHAEGGFAPRHSESVMLHGEDVIARNFEHGREVLGVPELSKVLFYFKGG
jgi:hypothetical protein